MPVYSYRCPSCHASTLAVRKIEARHDLLSCVACGDPMEKQIDAPYVQGDFQPYQCPITDKWILGRKEHTENLARHNCRVFEPGEREENTRRGAALDAAEEAAIDATIEKEILSLPNAKREKLAAEMDAGITAEVVRI